EQPPDRVEQVDRERHGLLGGLQGRDVVAQHGLGAQPLHTHDLDAGAHAVRPAEDALLDERPPGARVARTAGPDRRRIDLPRLSATTAAREEQSPGEGQGEWNARMDAHLHRPAGGAGGDPPTLVTPTAPRHTPTPPPDGES